MTFQDPFKGARSSLGAGPTHSWLAAEHRQSHLSAGENVINTLIAEFFFAISENTSMHLGSNGGVFERFVQALDDEASPKSSDGTRSNRAGSKSSPKKLVAQVVQLLDNPSFHLTCEAIRRGGGSGRNELQVFVQSYVILGQRDVQPRWGKQTTALALHQYYIPPRHLTEPEFAEIVTTFMNTASPFKGYTPFSSREAPTALLSGVLQAVLPFRVPDMAGMVSRMTSLGITPEVARSDSSLEAGKDLYRALAQFVVNYSRLVIKEENIGGLLGAHQFKTLEEAGQNAIAAVVSRMDAKRANAREQERAEAERKAALQAAQIEEFGKEAAAAQLAEEKRRLIAESDRQQALDEYHASFQEVSIPENIQIMLDRLGSGNGIPESRRKYGEIIVDQILNPLRRHLFDARGDLRDRMGDPAVEELSRLVFSATTIAALAKCFIIDPQKCFNVPAPTGRTAEEAPLKRLCELYETSPAVRGIIQTMLNQADGIIVLGVLALPLSEGSRYAQERNWEASGVNRAGQDIRAPLARKLRKVIEDKMIVRAARLSLVSSGEPTLERKKSALELPAWIESVVNPDEFAYSLEDGQLLVASREVPTVAMYIPAKGLASKEGFQKEYKQRLNDLLSDVAIEKRLESFKTLYGFEVSHERVSTGRQVSLFHRESELSEVLEGLSNRWHGPLDSLEQRFQQYETSWGLLFERAQRVGFKVTRNVSGTVMRHPATGEHVISSGMWAPKSQLHRVTTLVNHAERSQEQERQEAERKRQRALKAERIVRQEVLPGLGNEIIVPDANLFMMLSAHRSGGRTWLDLLSATAALPHVRMMVPAIIADFELTGRVVPFETQDKSGDIPSMLSWTSSAVQTFKDFFEGATRIKVELQPDGTSAVTGATLGTNRNVCIVESPGDEEFYLRVRALEQEARGNVRRFHERVRAELYHRGEGDAAITRFLNHSPFMNRVSVITSDIRYMKNEMPMTTGLGAPVSGCSAGSYVAAECDNRGAWLGEILATPEPIHFHTITDDIAIHFTQSGMDVPFLVPYERFGRGGASGLTPKSILHALQSGADDLSK